MSEPATDAKTGRPKGTIKTPWATPERRAYIAAHWPTYEMPALIFDALMEMEGPPVPDNAAITILANRMGVTRPKDFRKSPEFKAQQLRHGKTGGTNGIYLVPTNDEARETAMKDDPVPETVDKILRWAKQYMIISGRLTLRDVNEFRISQGIPRFTILNRVGV